MRIMQIFVDYEKDKEEIAICLEVNSEKEVKILQDLFNVEEKIANIKETVSQDLSKGIPLVDEEYYSTIGKKGYKAYLAIGDSGYKFKIVLPIKQFF